MRLLLVEDSKVITSLVQSSLRDEVGLPVDCAATASEAVEMVAANGPENYFLAILDLTLPDAPNGEIVKKISDFQIPSIIFSANYDEQVRTEVMQTSGVVDYVVKESNTALKYLRSMVGRLYRNRDIKALIVDDSKAVRMLVAELLRQYQFQVFEASGGEEALSIISENMDIKLVVTDYNMGAMDGFELTKEIRQGFDQDEVIVIGLSGTEAKSLSARFIKTGANDFIRKPFEPEEFFCRISQNLDAMERNKALKDAATKDFLTGLYNRRYFFERAEPMIVQAIKKNKEYAVTMLDIDHFKSVNDTFGHDVGDEVLVAISEILAKQVGSQGLLARFGGEEFCVLIVGQDKEQLEVLFENTRAAIEAKVFASLKERRNVTCSFGVYSGLSQSLDEGIKIADETLYEAKTRGRNRITFA